MSMLYLYGKGAKKGSPAITVGPKQGMIKGVPLFVPCKIERCPSLLLDPEADGLEAVFGLAGLGVPCHTWAIPSIGCIMDFARIS